MLGLRRKSGTSVQRVVERAGNALQRMISTQCHTLGKLHVCPGRCLSEDKKIADKKIFTKL